MNVSGLVLDELHAQPNRNLVDVLTKGSDDVRTQPMYFLITTAGTDRNSICFEYHQKAIGTLSVCVASLVGHSCGYPNV